jgi:hypothetical protein
MMASESIAAKSAAISGVTKLARPVTVDEFTARAALETVPPLYRLHTAVNRVLIAKWRVAGGTEQRRSGRRGLSRHAGSGATHTYRG